MTASNPYLLLPLAWRGAKSLGTMLRWGLRQHLIKVGVQTVHGGPCNLRLRDRQEERIAAGGVQTIHPTELLKPLSGPSVA